jgi:murein DD-endopeptidase MepM/ murein hydrolase activator NlpD
MIRSPDSKGKHETSLPGYGVQSRRKNPLIRPVLISVSILAIICLLLVTFYSPNKAIQALPDDPALTVPFEDAGREPDYLPESDDSSQTATYLPAAIEAGNLEIGQQDQFAHASLKPVQEPLQFVFPEPRQPPVSALRPPLYPIPWAPSSYDHFYFSRPIAADEINWPLWDYRYGGTFFENVVHTGIDIPTPVGTPVLAAGPGKVIWAGYGLYMGNNDPKDPYGLAVTILHDFNYKDDRLYTVYAHMDRIDVVRGQVVETGEVIGLSGATGQVTGAHLHFEVRMGKNDFYTTRNPELWLAPPQGWGVLVGRIQTPWGNKIPYQTVIVRSKSSGQKWEAKSYGLESVNPDPVYQENLVISDLPAGQYEVKIPYLGRDYTHDIEIMPGLVTYLTFRGWHGFFVDPPVLPGSDFSPE